MSIRKSLRSACGEECTLGYIIDGEHHIHSHSPHKIGHKVNLLTKETPGSNKRKHDLRVRKPNEDFTEYKVHSIIDAGRETTQLGSIFLDDEFADLSYARIAIQYASFISSDDNFKFVSNIGTRIEREDESITLVSSISDVNSCILIDLTNYEDDESSEDEIEEENENTQKDRPTTLPEGFKRLYGDRGREIIQRAKDKVRNLVNSDYNNELKPENDVKLKTRPDSLSEDFKRMYGDRGRDIIKKAKEKVLLAKQGPSRPSRRVDSLDRINERMTPRESTKKTSPVWRLLKQVWLPLILLLVLLLCIYYSDYLKNFIVGGNAAVVAVVLSSLLLYGLISLCRLVTCRIFGTKSDKNILVTGIMLLVLFPVFAYMFLFIFSYASDIFEKASQNVTNINSTNGSDSTK